MQLGVSLQVSQRGTTGKRRERGEEAERKREREERAKDSEPFDGSVKISAFLPH